eukprot:PhF_6_TR12470/c0_g1_i1/m.19607
MAGLKRLEKELLQLQPKAGGTLPSGVLDVSLADDSSILLWKVIMEGPAGTPYHGGKFTLHVTFTTEYPMKPPSLKFNPPLFHPSVSLSTGEVCAALPVLASWKPTATAKDVLGTVAGLLLAPSAENVVEDEVARMLRDQPAEFEKAVKKHMKDNKMI